MSQAFAHFTTIYYKIWRWGIWKSYVYIYLILLFNSQTIITFIYYILKRKTIDMLENLTNKKHILHFNLTAPLLISEPQKAEKNSWMNLPTYAIVYDASPQVTLCFFFSFAHIFSLQCSGKQKRARYREDPELETSGSLPSSIDRLSSKLHAWSPINLLCIGVSGSGNNTCSCIMHGRATHWYDIWFFYVWGNTRRNLLLFRCAMQINYRLILQKIKMDILIFLIILKEKTRPIWS